MTTIPALLQPLKDQLAAATELGEWEVRGKDVVIYAPNGFGAYRVVAWVDHAEYTPVIAAAPTDQAKLIAAIEAVSAPHQESHPEVELRATDYKYTGHHCVEDGEKWPCPTVAAITQALGGDRA